MGKVSSNAPESERPMAPHVEVAYAGTAEITDQLADLYLQKKKWAGSGLVEDYQSVGDPLPKVGNYWMLLRSNGEVACLLKTERIVFNKFKDVPEEIAIAEGEDDLSLKSWRDIHEKFFSPNLEKWGVKDINEATVITEFFKLEAIF